MDYKIRLGKRINLKRFCKVYMMVFCFFMLIVNSVYRPGPTGEWDDYSLPVASILSDHNFTISQNDVVVYKKIFPDWASYIDNYRLSGYLSKNGSGEMPWYFPTYSLVCIPLVWLLDLCELPTIYAFPYTNLLFLMFSLVFIYYFLKTNEKKKR